MDKVGKSPGKEIYHLRSNETQRFEEIVDHVGDAQRSVYTRESTRVCNRVFAYGRGRSSVTWSPLPAAQILIEVSPWRKIPPNGNTMSPKSRKMARNRTLARRSRWTRWTDHAPDFCESLPSSEKIVPPFLRSFATNVPFHNVCRTHIHTHTHSRAPRV